MSSLDLDGLSDEESRDLLRRIVDSLELAEDEGAFGNESWHGFLEIDIEE